jgi:DNA-binding CsgD family transcriptional regulator
MKLRTGVIQPCPAKPGKRGVRISTTSASADDCTAVLVGIADALGRLRGAVSLQALFSHAAGALCESLDFERAAVFSLRDHALMVESVCARDMTAEGEGALEQLCSEPVSLGPGLHESEVLRRRRVLLVRDAATDPRALATLPGASSYVAAPVTCQERTVGLVHADRGLSGQEVTELDRTALSAFVEGLGHALERVVLAERLRTHADRVLSLTRAAEVSVAELSRPLAELPSPRQRSSASAAPAMPVRELQELLTRREGEVLAMLADGETNAGIAQRLVVSEDTIKTHVKHILRKLGVQNRSQAVSRHFRSHAANGGRPLAATGYGPE